MIILLSKKCRADLFGNENVRKCDLTFLGNNTESSSMISNDK